MALPYKPAIPMILPLASKAPRFLYALFFILVTGCILSIVTYYPLVKSTICQCQADLRLPAQTPSSNSYPLTIHKTFFPPNPQQGHELLDQARLTANGGFFMVKDTPSSKAYGYGISMLHQSHCVDMLRAALFGGEHDHTLHFKRDGLRDVDSLDDGHLEHCLDYISQGIVCAADDTLEPRVIDWEKRVAVINGKGVVHHCRDSSVVLDAVAQSQVDPVLLERKIEQGERLNDVLRSS